MRGHLYCSERCARDAGRHAVWRRVRGVLVLPVPARLAVALVVLAAAAPLPFMLRTVRELDRLSDLAPQTRPPLSRGRGPASVPEAATPSAAAAVPAARPTPAPAGVAALQKAPAEPAPVSRPTLAPIQAMAPQAPPPSMAGATPPDLTRGPDDRKDVLVSFDAGSSERGAVQILDALTARGIRTTIFVTGEFIRRYPDIVRRIAADGHEVGNHTDTHPHLTTYAADGRQATRRGVDRAFLAGELGRTARLYRETTGRSMAPLWRAPFGEHNAEIRRWAAEQGYWHVGWTGGRTGLDGLDWITDSRSRFYQPAERLLARLVQHAENGGIVLLHLGSDRDEPVASQIGILFDGLRARGFRFARASEFLEREGFDATRLASFRGPAAQTLVP